MSICLGCTQINTYSILFYDKKYVITLQSTKEFFFTNNMVQYISRNELRLKSRRIKVKKWSFVPEQIALQKGKDRWFSVLSALEFFQRPQEDITLISGSRTLRQSETISARSVSAHRNPRKILPVRHFPFLSLFFLLPKSSS